MTGRDLALVDFLSKGLKAISNERKEKEACYRIVQSLIENETYQCQWGSRYLF